MTVVENSFVPTEQETETVRHFSRQLARDIDSASRVLIQQADDPASVEVPKPVFEVLTRVLGIMAEGKAFAVIPLEKELTTQQAADMLNVSRPYLNKILDLGEIPHRKVGRNRRIKFGDLASYKEKQGHASRTALQELADQAQELNMGY